MKTGPPNPQGKGQLSHTVREFKIRISEPQDSGVPCSKPGDQERPLQNVIVIGGSERNKALTHASAL